ncbi:hypothetical protein A2Z23_01780 [Candidatus Curtissbacteria bacterium RBG_16_39_7]|uniref:Membrane protein 6-pyruvoyl-tetrahydropterin synthase-related domain-containing protein n=1 Tax=Candidatus Curtissbacteria bacterium RBG_16_39_7 TaxID=1797707 RepID=A0A1F5G257_9BACT|nr:MAG: hypothetical protein A2Z23_01780 [Candidatus Curtissbacteria bacterium RBG_16_39_7]
MRKELSKILYPIFLFLLSLWLFSSLLKLAYPALQPSVEPTVWAQVEFIKNNFPNLSWNPFWYLGYPFRFSGPPVFVYLLAFFSKILGVSIPEIEKWLILTLLSLIPLSLYIFTSFLLKNRFWAFLASVFFLVVPSFGYIFPQAYTSGFNVGLAPWHFVGFLTYGGGQRILGLAILPLSLLFFWQALEKWKHFWVALAVVSVSFLFLSDHVTSVSFLIGVLIILISLGWDKLGRALIILALAFLLVSFWYTPSYIQNILFSPSLAGKPLKDIVSGLARFLIVLMPSLLAVLALKKRRVEISFTILWLFLFLFLAFLYFLTDSDFLAEYSRFFPEIDIGIVMSLGLIAARVKGFGVKGFLLVVIAAGLGFRMFFGFPIVHSPLKLELEIANQLKNISNGQRIYLSGSGAFWFEFFAPNIPQVRGGVDQAATNPFWARASYQLREGESPELAEGWLKALRVGYVVVHDKDSKEYYHDFKYPGKFSGLDKVFDNGRGDKIYKIEGAELARIVKTDGLKGLKKPKDGSDSGNLGKYVSWLDYDRQRLPQVSWISPSQIAINAPDLKEGEGISLAVTWDRGWQIQCKMQNAKCKINVKKDPIGNIFIDPASSGNLEIILKHGPRIDNWFGYILSLLSLFALVFFPKIEPRLKRLTPESLRKEFEEDE